MTQLTDNIFASQVPQDKTCQPEDMTFANFYPHASKEVDEIIWIKCNGNSFTQKIPPGTYRFLFTTEVATEEQLKPLDYVLQHNNFKERFIDFCNRLTYFFNRKDSLDSLLLSKKLNPENNYAIIEKLTSNAD